LAVLSDDPYFLIKEFSKVGALFIKVYAGFLAVYLGNGCTVFLQLRILCRPGTGVDAVFIGILSCKASECRDL
jgi:hypothetical protein